ncbi:N-terminal acetyltransferase [Podila clonocystis]|nr:N-terminal acetyltransferase [Podila clonocystis]
MASLTEEHFTQEQIFAILRRINYPLDNPNVLPEPTLETLRELNYRCMTSIPFELFSLRATKSRCVDLSLDAIYDRIINKSRGGWCFSLNKFACELLRGVGFTVQYTLGRVCKPDRHGDPIVYLGLSHRLTIVRLPDDSKWVFDIGFGVTSFYPLKLEDGFEVEYFGHKRRMTKAIHNEEEPHLLGHPAEELWQVQEYMGEDKDGEKWTPCYGFTERQFYAVDCDMGNFWCSLSPNSPFNGELWVINATQDGHYNVLINRTFKTRSGKGTMESITIETEQQRQDILKKYFGIELTEEEWKYYDIKIE